MDKVGNPGLANGKWSEAEDVLLRPHALEKGSAELHKRLVSMLEGRTPSSVQTRIRRLRQLAGRTERIPKWTEAENERLLASHEPGEDWDEELLRSFPGREPKAVHEHWKILRKSMLRAREDAEAAVPDVPHWPGRCACLRCRREFASECVRRNRICGACLTPWRRRTTTRRSTPDRSRIGIAGKRIVQSVLSLEPGSRDAGLVAAAQAGISRGLLRPGRIFVACLRALLRHAAAQFRTESADGSALDVFPFPVSR